jgi:thioester reductase-like protein
VPACEPASRVEPPEGADETASRGIQETQRSEANAGDVLLTGATGFLGMELLARYLERTDRRIHALVRGTDDREASARLEGTLRSLFGEDHPYGPRVSAVRGDITRPDLGLRERDRLAERVGEIVHGAASVSFELGLQQSRWINVEGTRRVLDFAERCEQCGGLRRLSYISTAYVAGEHEGRFTEQDLDVGQSFRNPYEQSKFEAESLVARSRGQMPITVLRPSIVVGERDSGWTASFNVLYWPLRAFARGAYAALPARREAPVDIVPVDYVADAIFTLTDAPEAEGGTYHLTASAQATSVGELVELATTRFGRRAPRLIEPWLYRRLVHPLLMRTSRDERRRRALKRSETFFPYFAMSVTYDDRRSREALRSAGVEAPPLRRYFDRLVEYALDADWGRQPRGRANTRRRVARAADTARRARARADTPVRVRTSAEASRRAARR